MRFNWLAFWRTSFIIWLTMFFYVASMQFLHHTYPNPVLVLLPPLAFTIFSGYQIRRIKGR